MSNSTPINFPLMRARNGMSISADSVNGWRSSWLMDYDYMDSIPAN